MIFLQHLFNLPNSTTGLDQITIQTIAAVPGFSTLLLLFVFFVTFLGGISRQKARTGTSDYAMLSTIASLSTLMITLILSAVAGFIDLITLGIVVAITFLSGFWLFLDRKTSEV